MYLFKLLSLRSQNVFHKRLIRPVVFMSSSAFVLKPVIYSKQKIQDDYRQCLERKQELYNIGFKEVTEYLPYISENIMKDINTRLKLQFHDEKVHKSNRI